MTVINPDTSHAFLAFTQALGFQSGKVLVYAILSGNEDN